MGLDAWLSAEVEGLLARFETEPEHTRHVARLALRLFDLLADLHGLGRRDRDLLEVAALLHDVGWSQCEPDGRGHHKASARLIRAHPWRGLLPGEVECVAEAARYHRKGLPDPARHPSYARLGGEDQRRVRWLAALLRVADGLDRRHAQRVDGLSVVAAEDGLRVLAESPVEVGAELGAADKKADLLRGLVPDGWGVRFGRVGRS